MRSMLMGMWRDDRGALIATEWIFVVTILVIGLVVGLASVKGAILNELEEVAAAFGALTQSYGFGGSSGCCSSTDTSFYTDESTNLYEIDTCVETNDTFTTSCAD